MLKTLLAQVKEFKADSIKTPICMILEVAMEMLIPLMMASIIDDGVNAGNMQHIFVVGICIFYWKKSDDERIFEGEIISREGSENGYC